jgi:hypothetical protein
VFCVGCGVLHGVKGLTGFLGDAAKGIPQELAKEEQGQT